MAANQEPNLLGEFLRARRELMSPSDLGLPETSRRRVRGLRREEVAMRAGVSADYYVHLEQGRDRHPSEEVIQSLALVLKLEDDAITYLRQLAAPRFHRRRSVKTERVSPGLLQILGAWSRTAAIVQGRFRDVLAATTLATALHPGLRYDRNTVRLLFLDDDERAMHVDWERDARESVSWLRAAIGGDVDNPRVNELVGELAVKSEEFGRIWARHDVRKKSTGSHRLDHPLVGDLHLGYETFSINSSPGQSLTLYHGKTAKDTRRLEELALKSGLPASDSEHTALRGGSVVLLDDHRQATG